LSASESNDIGLNTVIHRDAEEMHQGFGKGVKNALVKIRVLARNLESHVLATLLGDVTDEAGKAAEQLLDGYHADFQDALVQLIQDAGLKRHGVGKPGPQGIAGVLLVKLRECAI